MLADFNDGPEHSTLQSEAGYIDARPQANRSTESLLQRTAAPYIAVSKSLTQSLAVGNVAFEKAGAHRVTLRADPA